MSDYDAVLFDLDGTLADTAGDLGHALNLQRKTRGLQPIPMASIRPHASAGARGLLRLGFDLEPGDPEYEAMRSEFLALYAQNLSRSTELFAGVASLLDTLSRFNLRWGVVTNKPKRFTIPVLRALGLLDRAACVICGDMASNPKPHPAPLLDAAAALNLRPAACLYVGDDERDVIAAHAAGMDVVVALYGYLGNGTPPQAWGAEGTIESPPDLVHLMRLENRQV